MIGKYVDAKEKEIKKEIKEELDKDKFKPTEEEHEFQDIMGKLYSFKEVLFDTL